MLVYICLNKLKKNQKLVVKVATLGNWKKI